MSSLAESRENLTQAPKLAVHTETMFTIITRIILIDRIGQKQLSNLSSITYTYRHVKSVLQSIGMLLVAWQTEALFR